MGILNKQPVGYTIVDALRDLGFKVGFNGRSIWARYCWGHAGARIYMNEAGYELRFYSYGTRVKTIQRSGAVNRWALDYISNWCSSLEQRFHFELGLDEVDWGSVIY